LRIPDIYQAVWRHRIFVMVMTALVVLAVGLVTARQQKLYTASTLVRIVQAANDPTDVVNSLEAGQRLAQTYARIAETRTIRDQIQRELGSSIAVNRIDISASPVEDLELLTISATDSSKSLAREVANAAPEALRAFVQQSSTPREQVIVVERARTPSAPSSPRLKLNLALALVVGLVLNSLLALLAEILRDPLPDGQQLEELLNRPVLATVPTLEFIQPQARRFGRGRKAKRGRRVDREIGRARTLSARFARDVLAKPESRVRATPPASERGRQ
jgi:capsular polysaccharide biosynthesis protein